MYHITPNNPALGSISCIPLKRGSRRMHALLLDGVRGVSWYDAPGRLNKPSLFCHSLLWRVRTRTGSLFLLFSLILTRLVVVNSNCGMASNVTTIDNDAKTGRHGHVWYDTYLVPARLACTDTTSIDGYRTRTVFDMRFQHGDEGQSTFDTIYQTGNMSEVRHFDVLCRKTTRGFTLASEKSLRGGWPWCLKRTTRP